MRSNLISSRNTKKKLYFALTKFNKNNSEKDYYRIRIVLMRFDDLVPVESEIIGEKNINENSDICILLLVSLHVL